MRFEEFAGAQAQRLVALAYALIGDEGAAEDVVQTVLSRMAQRWLLIRHPLTYARRAVANAAIDHYRNQRETPTDAEHLHGLIAARVHPLNDPDFTDLHEAIARLPDKQRVVLVLRHFEGLESAEIADICSSSQSTVRSNLARAHATLKATLSEATQPDGTTQR